MSRPPDPPKTYGLLRRAQLTLQYHGGGELLKRAVLFPLRPTPLGRRLGHGVNYGPENAVARRWYAENWRPVTVVVPTYGDPSLVEQCVRSLRKTTDPERARVVVVDDCSDAVHRDRLGALDGAEVVFQSENRGYSAAVNAGIARAREADDIVVLNSDVVASKRWLERLQYAAYRGKENGIVGPKLLYPDGRIQSAGTVRNLEHPEWFDHRMRFRDGADRRANIAVPVLATTGAAMYLKRPVLDELGGFDEAYGMGYEDVDLCLRAWEAGWQISYAPRSELLHLESQTRAVDPGPRELASQELFWSRWRPWFDERAVHAADGRLRIVYVTEDTGVGGGHRDIFEHVNRLRARGHDATVWSLAGQPDWFDLDCEVRQFEDYAALAAALEPVEAIKVATWWNTAHTVWRASVRRGIGVFFVQDIETSYYPDSQAMRDQVLLSYREEFRYMTISGWNRQTLHELGREAVLMPPGLDVDNFRPLPGVQRRDDMLLALGRTNPLKNLPLTIDSWHALGATRPELCLFGIEPELGPKYGATYVELPSDAEVNELFNRCTVFVQTSTHEGFCLPPLEAMATGAAVVCTDAHGNRDFCVDGQNCLIPDSTVESVSGAIARLLADPVLRGRLGEAGLRTAEGYAWERRIDELEAYYESLAVGARPTAPAGA